MKVTQADLAALADVQREAVGWLSNVAGRVSFRLWTTEYDYVTVTPRLKRLEAAGLVRRRGGWRYGAGYVELTDEGRAALSA